MKIIIIFIVTLFSLTSTAGVCDTLGFKVNVPKISKADDRVVGIKITFDTSNRKINRQIYQRNMQTTPFENNSSEKSIRISCHASLSVEEPLIVLDGIVLDGRLPQLNPDEIKSIDILKSSAAQALYGYRAMPGVILIRTKKDKAREIARTKGIHSTESLTKAEGLKIYPNFITRGLSINIELSKSLSDRSAIQFYNFSGQVVFQQQLNPGSNIHRIQLPSLTAGIYEVVTFDKLSQKTFSGKLVVL